MKLAGKTALITGGASGIGKASAVLMAQEGANVVIADVDDQAGMALEKQLNVNSITARFMHVDVTDEEQVQEAVAFTVTQFGRLDIMFNNAGISIPLPVAELTLAQWQKVIDINLTGVFLGAKYAALQMQKTGGGCIINTSSILGTVGKANNGAYSAAKGGVTNFTRTLALELAAQGIRVNSISPGYIDTPILAGKTPEQKAKLAADHPLGRLGIDEEVAKAVVFLASDEASFITGTNLHIDGGYTAGK